MPKERSFFLPAGVDRRLGAWVTEESVLDRAQVDLGKREARVPPPHTPAQKLARYHELYHVRHAPTSWQAVAIPILQAGVDQGISLDMQAVVKIGKMLEETRTDWRLWSKLGIDVRPCRESLSWGAMSTPDDNLLEAVCWTLQLAWTVWGSTGIWADELEGMPEVRDVKPAVLEFHKACWDHVLKTNSELATDLIRGVTAMIVTPTHAMRDKITLELARYFPIEEEYQQPEPDEEEKELQEEIEQEIAAEEEQKKQDESGGDLNAIEDRGTWELHDHTRGPRRPRVVVRKKWTAKPEGTIFKYPHRHVLDRMVFGRKSRQTGSILIDMSGSMKWKNEDMMFLLDQMPNLWIGGYSGVTLPDKPRIQGRLCVHAKNGVFNKFTGLEMENNGGNFIDLEALRYLGTQPEPRFWLSDGLVLDGLHGGIHPTLVIPMDPSGKHVYFTQWGKLIDLVNKTMRQYRILRINDKAEMVSLFKRHRVRVFQSTVAEKLRTMGGLMDGTPFYPPELKPLSLYYQL